MKKIKELIQAGALSEASEQLEMQLKDDPLNVDMRASYVELLCVKGDLEKADSQLDMMVRQNPDFLVGAVNLRQLIRAMQSRLDFYNGADTASIFCEADEELQTLLKLRLAIKDNQFAEAEALAAELEKTRKPTSIVINGKTVADIRDIDDSLCGYVELFGTDGKYYLAKFSELELLDVKQPESLLELTLRRVEVNIKNGPSGEAFLPIVYADSTTEAERLGRESDWNELAPQLFTGLGQKMWLADDQALAISDIQSVCSFEQADTKTDEQQAIA
ncbi:type VI secretion system accessory protein TagJ [Litoribrevibacter albus]|uniref:Protein of avirulence locus n=1 Tax=Litoribrevibacter albus TaxID=1473156 RepID=A0AA37SAN0_9GAMM|nr:type VI secretion system accessory protein TagJ [Litoribrevibacter albus]GLQ31854.1 protein of avirulence locus [Litoribrevibacter albus]